MKSLVGVVGLLLFAGATFASPLDRSREGQGLDKEIEVEPDKITEEVKEAPKKPRWVIVPDANYKMYLVDLNTYDFDKAPKWDAELDVFFMLYTRHNPTMGQRITLNAGEILRTDFNPNVPTRIVMHGWNNDHQSNVNTLIRDAYLYRGDFNVIVVDWGYAANTVDYITASYRVKDAAIFLAKFIDYMVDAQLIRLDQLLLAGHSLGGHGVGLAGKFVTRGKVETIIGMDPAGPLYTNGNPAERIAQDDGNYVEIIHTNGWNLGFGDPIGQSDFYPNFGYSQPGCGIDITGSCAHSRAYEYFAESIYHDYFYARGCTSTDDIYWERCTENGAYAKMGGEPPNSGVTGYFVLETNSASPFARG